MKLRSLIPMLAITTLAACSGGSNNATPNLATSASTSQGAKAFGTLTINAPKSSAQARAQSDSRTPKYVSTATTFATLWFDGSVTGSRVSCNSAAPCTINWTSTSGPHTIIAELDDATSPTSGGNVLAMGGESVNLNVGANTLAALTLNGVPAGISLQNVTIDSATSSICENGQADGNNCAVVTFAVLDADGNAITTPGSFDDGGLNLLNTADLYLDGGPYQPDAVGNDYSIFIQCQDLAPSNSTFGFEFGNSIGSNGLPSNEAISAQQLSNYSLTYATTLTFNNWVSYLCTNGQVSVSGPADGTITVQSTKKH